MFSVRDIDEMMAFLEPQIALWACTFTEEQFVRTLGHALDYIAAGACAEARLHCLKRTGRFVPGSGSHLWYERYGRQKERTAGTSPGTGTRNPPRTP